MARRTKEEAEQTRQQLLDTALALFSEKGLANVTLAKVASAAGVTRGAIYWHFKDKAEMINALWEQAFRPMSEQFEGQIKDGLEHPLQSLEMMCGRFLQELVSDEHLQRVSRLCQQATYDEKMHEVWREQCLRDQKDVHYILTQAKEKGELKEELTVEVATMMVFCFVSGVMERWLLMPEFLDLENHGNTMLAAFFDGLKKKG